MIKARTTFKLRPFHDCKFNKRSGEVSIEWDKDKPGLWLNFHEAWRLREWLSTLPLDDLMFDESMHDGPEANR